MMPRLPKPSFEMLSHYHTIISKAAPNPISFDIAWKACLNTYLMTTEEFETERNKRLRKAMH